MNWILGAGTIAIHISFANALANGLVTVTLAFFLLEHVLQSKLVPYVFPTGGLYKIPKTVRIRIRMRLAALMATGSLIPLLFILHLIYRAPIIQSDPAAALEQLRSAITIIICVFLILAFLLTVLVNRNLISRFNEIVQTLQWVRNGRFDKKVKVTSNDEIGYTGDIINEMTDGLIERERMQQSLNLAREVQQNLLPKRNLTIGGFDIAGKSIYCDETGGDYFDIISMGSADKSKIGVAIGDVSGHGISSALLMAAVRSSLRLRASLPGSIGAIVSDVNRQLVQDVEDSGQFMTMFFLALNSDTRELEWVRAGHEPAIVYDPHEDVFNELGGPGIALGVDDEWGYEGNLNTGFSKDHVIFLSTDGVWEVRNKDGQMLGKEPVLNAIRQSARLNAPQINETIFATLTEFVGNAKIEDDITSVVIKIKK
jgi:sigma-B regulation protein RsbU (phosphoserine phosphatase)